MADWLQEVGEQASSIPLSEVAKSATQTEAAPPTEVAPVPIPPPQWSSELPFLPNVQSTEATSFIPITSTIQRIYDDAYQWHHPTTPALLTQYGYHITSTFTLFKFLQ